MPRPKLNPPVRFPLVVDPQNRLEDFDQDARLVNGFIEAVEQTDPEQGQGQAWVYKRPGLYTWDTVVLTSGAAVFVAYDSHSCNYGVLDVGEEFVLVTDEPVLNNAKVRFVHLNSDGDILSTVESSLYAYAWNYPAFMYNGLIYGFAKLQVSSTRVIYKYNPATQVESTAYTLPSEYNTVTSGVRIVPFSGNSKVYLSTSAGSGIVVVDLSTETEDLGWGVATRVYGESGLGVSPVTGDVYAWAWPVGASPPVLVRSNYDGTFVSNVNVNTAVTALYTGIDHEVGFIVYIAGTSLVACGIVYDSGYPYGIPSGTDATRGWIGVINEGTNTVPSVVALPGAPVNSIPAYIPSINSLYFILGKRDVVGGWAVPEVWSYNISTGATYNYGTITDLTGVVPEADVQGALAGTVDSEGNVYLNIFSHTNAPTTNSEQWITIKLVP